MAFTQTPKPKIGKSPPKDTFTAPNEVTWQGHSLHSLHRPDRETGGISFLGDTGRCTSFGTFCSVRYDLNCTDRRITSFGKFTHDAKDPLRLRSTAESEVTQ